MNKPIFCVSVGFYGTTFPRLPTVFDTGNLMSQPQSVKQKRAAGEADQPPPHQAGNSLLLILLGTKKK